MPKIQQWAKFPEALRRHLIDRMRDRSITLTDLNQLRLEQILKFPWETGTKISDRSSCAEKGHIRKLSSCVRKTHNHVPWALPLSQILMVGFYPAGRALKISPPATHSFPVRFTRNGCHF
jgi:hypothetical protein